MLQADRYSSREMTSSCEESGDEELSVLPRHTKVVVTGNNRTKSVLIGLHGVVKKAVGLGGWHWLVLKNGIEVKLQRNALSVVEAPTGHEEDEIENDSDSRFWGTADLASEELRKPFKPKLRNHKPTCTTSKSCIRNTSSDLHSCSRSSSQTTPKVNFSKLETEALRRYWKHFNLVEINANPSKEQLVDIVERHFISQQLDELQVIAGFIQAAKRLKSAHIAGEIQD